MNPLKSAVVGAVTWGLALVLAAGVTGPVSVQASVDPSLSTAAIHAGPSAQKNLALVKSGAYKQKRCPVTGGALTPGTGLNVGGVTVLFSSSNARVRIAKAGAKARIQLVFSPGPFSKAFVRAR